MMRIVDMKRSGVFVVLNGGALTAIEGRSHWSALEDVRNALRRNGLSAAERVLEIGGR